MKRTMLIAVAFALDACGVLAAPYTVTIGLGGDRSLETDEIQAILASDEFVKDGVGKLTVGSELASFTGKITVKAGAYEVTNGGAFGTAAGKTYVEDGAALVITSASSDANINQTEEVHIVGSGTADYPGAFVNAGKSVQYAFKTLYLDGDATFAVTASGATAGLCWGNIYFEGHTLTVNTPDVNKRFSLNRTYVQSAGHIDVARGALIVVGNSFTHTWNGGAANTVTIRKGAQLFLSNSTAIIPWTLNLEQGVNFTPDNATGFQNLNYNRWDGPVCCQGGNSYVSGTWTAGISLVLGPLTGAGTYRWWGGWVYLDGENSTGTGQLTFSGNAAGGLGINKATAISPRSKGIDVTSGDITLTAAGDYDLPPLTVRGSSSCSITGGKGVLASFYKTGPGTELFDSRLCVTGLAEIAEGTLKMPQCPAYGKPGLSVGWCSPASPGDEWWKRTAYTNRTALAIEHAYANYNDASNDFNGYTFAVYTGTIWNRTDADVTWTVASWMETGMRLYNTTTGYNAVLAQTSANEPLKAQLTLKPGANYFEVRLYRGDNICPRYKRLNGSSWPENFGLVFDRQGRDALDPSYFEKFEDPGDGSLFTCGPREEIVSADYRASFDNLKLSGGTLDLNDREITQPFPKLAGHGTLANGIVKVTGTLTLTAADVEAGGLTFTDADLVFADGASLVLDLSHREVTDPTAGVVLATVTDGTVTGLPESVTDAKGKLWKIACENGVVKAYYKPSGLMLIFR